MELRTQLYIISNANFQRVQSKIGYTESLKMLINAYDAIVERKFLILASSTNERKRKRKSMEVLVQRNRPSTKQWTSANFDYMKCRG